ncbi:XrtA/PEP-CTERM system exopolysaccharide export protein [Lichenicola sp.]|uniref:XrtA/PEP-CTERM system exopolysaccharide export protein n=1 Tax=Lichenicola sp. TaxID=2804529 RepID=UPI003AFF683F
MVLGLTACAGSPVSEAPLPVDPQTSAYIIGPTDKLSVLVYEKPDMSTASVPVRPDGQISLPLIHDIAAAGRTPAQLSHDIEARLATYVKSPEVTVEVLDFVGPYDQQIKVIGEAADPQAIPYRQHMTLLDVMIQTKGLTRFAAGNRAVIIRRDGQDREVSLHVRLADLIKDGDVSKNVSMQPGDTLIIPQTWF